jgi:xanthine dehydrogenase accessory factor
MVNVLEQAGVMLAGRRRVAVATVLPSGQRVLFDEHGTPIQGDLPQPLIDAVAAVVPGLIAREASGVMDAAGAEVFVEVLVPPPRLLLFGGGPIGEAVCAVAAAAGFEVEVGDPRPAFAVAERFPSAVAVHCGWPDQLLASAMVDGSTFVVSVLHEARFEDEVLTGVLRSPARYIGALGSRRTHAGRVDRLRESGFTSEEIGRIHAPVGLSIGAATPGEIAVAIVAEMVATRRQPSQNHP